MSGTTYPRAMSHPNVPAADFNWSRFVQVELHQLQIKESLEATLHEAEAAIALERQQAGSGRTLISFMQKAKPTPNQAAATVKNVSFRLGEVEKAREENLRQLHERLHSWLSVHDEHYRISAKVKDRYDEVAAAIEPMTGLFEAMRRRYGEARTEIGVAYDQVNGCLSATGQASVDRLIDSYSTLMDGEARLVNALNAINTLVNNTMFVKLRLPDYQRCIAPECTPGMDYGKMRENFEEGATLVNGAIDALEQYVARIRRVDYDREEILKEYRDAEWRRKLFAMASAA